MHSNKPFFQSMKKVNKHIHHFPQSKNIFFECSTLQLDNKAAAKNINQGLCCGKNGNQGLCCGKNRNKG